MASLDTNCLLRWFLDDIPAQCQRVEALLDGQETISVDDVAIIEAIFAMEHTLKLTRPTIRGLIDAIMTRRIVMNRPLWQQILDLWADHPKLSVVDIYLTVKASETRCGPLYTFDAKMVSQLPDAVQVP